MTNESFQTNRSADEVVLRDILNEALQWWKEIKAHPKTAIGIITGTLLLFALIAWLTPRQYEAKLTFMVNEDEGSKLGGVASLLESVGFGGAANSDFNLDKIIELVHSRRVIYHSLLDSTSVKGKKDLLANHIIDIYQLHKKWKRKKPKLQNFRFTSDSLETFSLPENTALKEIYKYVEKGENWSDPLLSTSIAPEAGIMTIEINSLSQELSRGLALSLFRELSDFYINKSIEKQLATYNELKQQVDSIAQKLHRKEYELARFEDRHQNLVPKTAQLRKERLEREIFILNTMYGEAVANKEVAGFALKNTTPFVQPIDLPVLPLTAIQPSWPKILSLGLLLGSMLAAIFIIGRMKVKKALQT